MSNNFTEQLTKQFRSASKDAAEKKWNDFVRRMKGKPESEIRSAASREWSSGALSDDAVAALSRGEDVGVKITFR